MSRTPSNMLPLKTPASPFNLYDTKSDKTLSLNELKGESATVVFFICNHCPYVLHVNEELVRLANDYSGKGVSCIAISSNDVENYPQDSPELMKKQADKLNYPFSYLYDESQEVARAYKAACTPDFFVFDANLYLVYRGQLDDSRPGNGVEVTGKYLRQALNDILTGKQISIIQKPSMGCNIKWKSEN